MLLKIENSQITSIVNISLDREIQKFKDNNPSFIEVPYFKFVEDVDLYEYVNDTIQLKAGWEAIKQERYLETLPSLLESEKDRKIELIKSSTNASASVAIGDTIYNGGDASASAIKGAIDFANIKNETEVGIWDSEDVVTVMPLADAMAIVIAIGEQYRSIMYERQARIASVKAIVIDPIGIYPTYEDAKTALDLI